MEQFNALREFVAAHTDGGLPAEIGAPHEHQRFIMLAQLAAWWNILLNLAIAAAFLSPEDRALSRYRNELLLVFCVVTYAIATVAGFGWLLIAMAVSQSDSADRRLRIVYTVVFALILLYREILWAEAIVEPLLGSTAGGVAVS